MDLKVKKADILFIGALVCLLLLFTLFLYSGGNGSENKTVTVTVDGIVIYKAPINEDAVITLENIGTLVIEDGSVYVTDPSCKDKLCQKLGKISKPYRSIICLPNRMIVSITSDNGSDIDGIAG